MFSCDRRIRRQAISIKNEILLNLCFNDIFWAEMGFWSDPKYKTQSVEGQRHGVPRRVLGPSFCGGQVCGVVDLWGWSGWGVWGWVGWVGG